MRKTRVGCIAQEAEKSFMRINDSLLGLSFPLSISIPSHCVPKYTIRLSLEELTTTKATHNITYANCYFLLLFLSQKEARMADDLLELCWQKYQLFIYNLLYFMFIATNFAFPGVCATTREGDSPHVPHPFSVLYYYYSTNCLCHRGAISRPQHIFALRNEHTT